MTAGARVPRIVVLDGHTANPGDLSWEPLAALGDLAVHPRSAPDETQARAEGAEILLTNKTLLPASVFEALPDLRCVSVLATGTNVVDLAAARERGVTVCNVPAYSTDSVAQTVFALILHHAQQVATHAEAVRGGAWAACPDFSFTLTPLVELRGRTLGVIGLGHIGSRVAGIGEAFGMRVLGRSRSRPEHSLETIFRESDFLSLHCPLTDETRHMVNAETLGWMKPSAVLVNTGRGPLVDEEALAQALREGRIAGAGLDVLSEEPPPADHCLVDAPNCVITPHCAWASRAARERLLDVTFDNIRSYLAGAPQNVVGLP